MAISIKSCGLRKSLILGLPHLANCLWLTQALDLDLPGPENVFWLAKITDLALILIDASIGFEMESFEFLSLLQNHGMPNIMGVLTHLVEFPLKISKYYLTMSTIYRVMQKLMRPYLH